MISRKFIQSNINLHVSTISESYLTTFKLFDAMGRLIFEQFTKITVTLLQALIQPYLWHKDNFFQEKRLLNNFHQYQHIKYKQW